MKVTLAMYGASQEISMLRHCQSQFAVQLLDSYNDGTVCLLVMELAGTEWTPSNPELQGLQLEFRKPSAGNRRINRRDLYGCLLAHGQLSPMRARQIFRSLVAILHFLHRNRGISHGDLKPQNLLITHSYNIKTADFSAAKHLSHGHVRRFAGAPMFASPEALKGEFCGEKNDIWACGVILWMLRFGADCEPQFQHGRIVWVKGMSAEGDGFCKDLVSRMLERDVGRRARIEEIMAHPYTGLSVMPMKGLKLETAESDATLLDGQQHHTTHGNDTHSNSNAVSSGLVKWLSKFAS